MKITDRTQTYKISEAAEVAGTGTPAIRRGIREGVIPHLNFGRTIRIPKAAFHRFLDNCGRADRPEDIKSVRDLAA